MGTKFCLAIAVATWSAVSAARGQDAAHQAAESNIAALKLDAAVYPSEHLLLATNLPPDRARQLSQYLQRQYEVTWKVLGLEDRDRSWSGPLTVYVLRSRPDFSAFLRTVEKRQPGRDESVSWVLTGDLPHLAVGAGLGEDEAGLPMKSARQLGLTLLQLKAGPNARLPAWVRDGYLKAVQLRANPTATAKERTRMKQLARLARLQDVWEATGTDGELIAASFMDFLMFGPDAKKLGPFLRGFTPGEGNSEPDVWRAMEVSELDRDMVAYAWKRWALTGK